MPNTAGIITRDLTTLAGRLGAAVDALRGRPFGPGTPLQPTVSTEETAAGPRQFQYPVAVNSIPQPRRDYPNMTPFEQLRNLAKGYDIAALCVRRITNVTTGLTLTIQAKDKKAQGPEQATCDALQAWLLKPDRVTPFSMWLAALVYDMLVLDAMTVYPHPAAGGGLWGLEVIDGATIKPLVDGRGQVAAYQQVLYGLPWSNYERPAPDADDDDFPQFSTQELLYLPRWPQSNSPYGFSPIEGVILRVNTALRKQTLDLTRFTDGNIPAAFANPPDGLLSPEQVQQFEDAFNAVLMGDASAMNRIKFFAWPLNIVKMNEFTTGGQYESTMDEWMAKITMAAFDVPPQELGFTADVNKATGGMQENIFYRGCIIPICTWLKQVVFDPIIQAPQYLGQPQLEAVWQFGETEDRESTAKTDQIYGTLGAVSPDELRTLRYPDLDGPAPGPPAAPGAWGAPSVQAAIKLAKAAPIGPDLEARRRKEQAAQRVFAAVYGDQAKRIKAVMSQAIEAGEDLPAGLASVWPGEVKLLTQAILPLFDELVGAGLAEGAAQVRIGVNWDLINEDALKLAQRRAQSFGVETASAKQRQIDQVVADWIANGGDRADLLARADRVWSGPAGESAAITAVTRIYAEANEAAWVAGDLVKGWRWNTGNDDRVCLVCGAFEGEEYELGEGPDMPAHDRCRCFKTPVVKGPREL